MHGTIRFIVFVVAQVRKFSMEKCTPWTRWPRHKQVFETEPALIFLQRDVPVWFIKKYIRNRVQSKWAPKGKKIPKAWSLSSPTSRPPNQTTKTHREKEYFDRK